MEVDPIIAFRPVAAFVLYLFLPLSALTYYTSRRPRRVIETERVLSLLKIDPAYRKAYDTERLNDYFWAVVYVSAVACLGLAVLFFSHEIGLAELPRVQLDGAQFPEQGSRLVLGMAFLGAYLWGVQHIFRRYAMNDLVPGVYYGLATRMIVAGATALVIYNAFSALAGDVDGSGGITANIWPSVAFVIGMFPQRGLRWLTERVPMLSSDKEDTVRNAPLEMIEGIEAHDVLRLGELGIDSCYDLATQDFVPLVLKTPYSARQVIDFILQAKACVYFGDAVKDLRRHGVRTLLDLESEAIDIEALATETSVTKHALDRAKESLEDPAIDRLREAGELLGTFWRREDESQPA